MTTITRALSLLVCMIVHTQVWAGWQSTPLRPGQVQSALKPKKLALVIGINKTRSPHWSSLRYALRDALHVGNTLRDVAKFDRIHQLVRPNNTTKTSILQSLRRLKSQIKSPLDTVFVYISAHGTVARHPTLHRRERYIVTYDTGKQVAKQGLSVRQILSELKSYTSKRIVLMLATCYTGLANSKSKPLPGAKGGLKPATPLRSRAIQVLSAAGYGQSAFESQSLRADVYTHFFLDCMKRLSQKAKAASTIEIHACASQPTTMYVKKQRSEIQVPKVDSEPGANRDIFLVGGAKKRGKRGYFWGFGRKGIASYALQPLVAQANQNQRIPSKQSIPTAIEVNASEYISLKPGRYRVKVQDAKGKVVKTYTITIQSGGIATTGGAKPPVYHEHQRRGEAVDVVGAQQFIIPTIIVGCLVLVASVAVVLIAVEPTTQKVVVAGTSAWARSQSSLRIPSKRAQSASPLWAVGGTAAAFAVGGLTAGLVIHHAHTQKRASKPSTLKTLFETK